MFDMLYLDTGFFVLRRTGWAVGGVWAMGLDDFRVARSDSSTRETASFPPTARIGSIVSAQSA